MDTWDPRKDDYEDPQFNSYAKGPGRNLPTRSQGYTKERHVQLYLQGIPKEIKEDGLEGLFSRAGTVKRTKIMQSKKENAGDTFGFVTMDNLISAERAIALFDGFRIGDFTLSVSVSKSKEELDNIRRQRMDTSLMAAPSNYGDYSDTDNDGDYMGMNGQSKQMNGVSSHKPEQTVDTGALGKGRGKKLREISGVCERGDADITLGTRPKLNSLSVDVGTDSVFDNTIMSGTLNDQLLTPAATREPHTTTLRQPGSYVRRERSQDEQYSNGPGRGRGDASFLQARDNFSYSGGRGRGQAEYNYGRGRGQGDFNRGRGGRGGYGRGYYQNHRGRGGFQNFYGGYGAYQPVMPMAGMPMPVIMQPYTMPPMYVPEQSKVDTQTERRECSVCGKLGSSRCSRCKIPYCGSKCQTNDWPNHKEMCNKSNEKENEITKTFEDFEVGVDDDLIPKVKALMEKATGKQFDITRKSTSPASPRPDVTRKSTSHASPRPSVASDDERSSTKVDNYKQQRTRRDSKESEVGDTDRDRGARGQDRGQDRGQRGRRTDGRDQRRGNDGNRTRTGGAPGDRGCFNCGEKTHMRSDCPVKNNQECFNCHEVGHISRDCPKKKGSYTPSGSQPSRGSSNNKNTDDDDWDDKPATSTSSKPVASSTPKETKKSPPKKNLPTVSMPLNEELRVVLCDVTDPGHFYLQINQPEYIDPFKDIMMEINQKYKESVPDVLSVMTGEIYCVRFSLDQLWYRAKVLRVSGDQVLVHFLDFGNTEATSLEHMRHLDDSLTQLPAPAVLCSLDEIIPATGDSWKIPDKELLQYMPTDQPLIGRCKSITDTSDGKLHCIILDNMNGESVGDKLVAAGLVRSTGTRKDEGVSNTGTRKEEGVNVVQSSPTSALPDTTNKQDMSVLMFCDMKKSHQDLVVGQEFPFAVSNVTSPIVFSVQMLEKSLVEKFIAFNAKFNEECSACTQSEYRPTVVGEVVASLFSQDKGWYRARVLEIVQTGAVVEYIDYLNSETVTWDMMRKATDLFTQFPAQGIMCTYDGLTEPLDGKWPEDLIALYLQMSQYPLSGRVKAVTHEAVAIEITISGESMTEAIHEIMSQHNAASPVKSKTSHNEEKPKQTTTPDKHDQAKTVSDSKVAVTANGDKKGQIGAGDLPMDGSKLKVMVTCVTAVDCVYVQDLDPSVEKRLNEMMLDLNRSIEAGKSSMKPNEGDCVAAVFTVSGTPLLHRACVKAKVSEDAFMVLLVDYGNTVCAKLEDIAPLDTKFLSPPAFAVQCQLAGTEESEDSDLLMKLQALTDHEVYVQAVNYNKGIFSIKVTLVDGTNVNEAFESYTTKSSPKSVKADSADKPTLATSIVTDSTRRMSIPLTTLPVDENENEMKVKIVYIMNLAKFYIHLCSTEQDAKLLECLKDMQIAYANDETVYTAEVGEYVAAYYNDGSGAVWYRARVLQTGDDDTVTVAIVDYGNEGVVAKRHIRQLDDQFSVLPVVACECRLVGSTGEEKKEMIDQFRCLETDVDDIDIVVVANIGQSFLIDIIMRDHHKTKVSEFLELDTSVTQSLITAGSNNDHDTVKSTSVITGSPVNIMTKTSRTGPGAESVSPATANNLNKSPTARKSLDTGIEDLELPLNSEISAVTFVIESIKSFFVQMADEETQKALATLMVQLSEYCSGTEGMYTPSAGEIVAALFRDGMDANWYRGQVIEVVDTKCAKVFFLDYGNTETVLFTDIRKIEPRFLVVPKIAIHCRLYGSGVETEAMLQKFQTISNVPMTVCARSYSNGLYEVDVTTPDGRNLSSDLGLIPDLPSGQNNVPSTDIVDNLPKQVSPKVDALPQKVSSPPKGEKKAVFTQTLKKSRPEGEHFKAIITSIMNPTDFHCQIYPEGEHTNLQQELKFLSDTMKLECDGDLEEVSDLTFEVGELCCAKFPVDNCWYRASVLETFPDKTVKVEYVDFGNCADVPVSLLRPVTMDYTRLPLLAFRCSLHGISPAGPSWTDHALIELAKFQDIKLDARVISIDNDVYTVELKDGAKDIVICEHLVATGLAKTVDATEEISEMEKLRRENEVMRRQMEALQAKLAGAK